MSKTILDELLCWLYQHDVNLNEDCIEDLIIGSKEWELDELLETCAEFLADNTKPTNVCVFYHLTLGKNMRSATDKCSYFIREKFEDLDNGGHLEILSMDEFHKVISNLEINIRREDIIYRSFLNLKQQTTITDAVHDECFKAILFNEITATPLADKTMTVYGTHPEIRAVVDASLQQTDVKSRCWNHLLSININNDVRTNDVLCEERICLRQLPNIVTLGQLLFLKIVW